MFDDVLQRAVSGAPKVRNVFTRVCRSNLLVACVKPLAQVPIARAWPLSPGRHRSAIAVRPDTSVALQIAFTSPSGCGVGTARGRQQPCSTVFVLCAARV